MKRSKGFIAQLIVAITFSIIFIGLGNWQLDRAHDVKVSKQFVPDSPRVNLESIASVTSNLDPSAINRLVKLSGNYRKVFIAPKQQLLTNGKKSTANLEVRLLELSGQRGILVVRGIENLEDQGYVMSGSRHQRMNAVRISKENQVYSAEEKRALAMITFEEKQLKENQIVGELRQLLEKKLQDSGHIVTKTAANDNE
jgi:cytochrome oxidase assembly protein ShyY1